MSVKLLKSSKYLVLLINGRYEFWDTLPLVPPKYVKSTWTLEGIQSLHLTELNKRITFTNNSTSLHESIAGATQDFLEVSLDLVPAKKVVSVDELADNVS